MLDFSLIEAWISMFKLVPTFEIEENGGPNNGGALDILGVSQSEFVVVVP